MGEKKQQGPVQKESITQTEQRRKTTLVVDPIFAADVLVGFHCNGTKFVPAETRGIEGSRSNNDRWTRRAALGTMAGAALLLAGGEGANLFVNAAERLYRGAINAPGEIIRTERDTAIKALVGGIEVETAVIRTGAGELGALKPLAESLGELYGLPIESVEYALNVLSHVSNDLGNPDHGVFKLLIGILELAKANVEALPDDLLKRLICDLLESADNLDRTANGLMQQINPVNNNIAQPDAASPKRPKTTSCNKK